MKFKKINLPWLDEIPENWEVVKLKNLGEFYTGNSIADNEKDNFTDNANARPYISTKDISKDDGIINYENGMYIKLNNPSFKIAPLGSTLVCIEGGSGGKKAGYLIKDVSFVNKLCCIRPNNFIHDKFTYFLIKSSQFKFQYNMSISGDRNGVNLQKIGQFFFSLPPKQEQIKIAAFLDDKVAKIDKAISYYEKKITSINFIKSQLISKEYKKVNAKIKLKMLLKNTMEYGLNMSGNLSGEYRYVRITDIDKNGNLKDGNMQYITGIEEKYILKDGDLLFARSGSVGKTYYYKNCDGKCAYAGYLIKANLDEKKAYSEYVYYFTQSTDYEKWKDTIFVQSTIQNINATKYSNLLIPFINKKEQLKIINNCKKIIKLTNKIEAKYQTQIKNLSVLKQSLISHAVSGKIDLKNFKKEN